MKYVEVIKNFLL